jgi:MraZ protein
MPKVEMPRSTARARIDDKGRIKLAADYLRFFDALPERTVFVTTTDLHIAEIYPIATWREMERFFVENEDLDAVQRQAFNAARYGSECDVDSQGRVNIHADLRRLLSLDNQELHVYPYMRERIQILTKEAFDKLDANSREANPDEDRKAVLAARRKR